MSSKGGKGGKKEVRRPVADNFAAKRLALCFQPPTLIMQYLVIDSGKLYHHKMRLDSILRKTQVTRIDVLNYVKNKHHLYFLSDKLKDAQILKFIDKIIARTTKTKPSLQHIQEEQHHEQDEEHPAKTAPGPFNQDDDFDYLNDDEYDEDYEDYEETEPRPEQKQEMKAGSKKEEPKQTMFNKNTFMTYCQEYEDENEEEGGAEWDLDMEGSADFV